LCSYLDSPYQWFGLKLSLLLNVCPAQRPEQVHDVCKLRALLLDERCRNGIYIAAEFTRRRCRIRNRCCTDAIVYQLTPGIAETSRSTFSQTGKTFPQLLVFISAIIAERNSIIVRRCVVPVSSADIGREPRNANTTAVQRTLSGYSSVRLAGAGS
jgi:hypothetical protein